MVTSFPFSIKPPSVKTNILRSLAELGCGVIVVPATTSFKEIMNYKPDGLFLSNGRPPVEANTSLPFTSNFID